MNAHPAMNVFDALARAWAGWALAASWQLALLVTLVAVAAFASRRLSARLRYLLWMLVLIKALTPPSLGASWSVGNWAGPEFWRQTRAKVIGALEKPEPPNAAVLAQPIGLAPPAAAIPPVESTALTMDPPAAAATASSVGLAEGRSFSAAAAALAVWLSGLVALALFIALRYGRLTRALAGAREVDEGPLRVALERLALRLGRREAPALLLSDAVSSPFLFGLLRPRIVLPASLPGALSPAQLEDVLLHELTHWRRRDLLSGWLQIVVQALFWFHPLVWLAGARLRHERECACDEEALQSGLAQPRRYGESILQVLLASRGRSSAALGFLGIFERNTRLQRRLEEIMNQEIRVHRFGRWSWALVALFALICMPMAAKKTASAAQSQDARGAKAEAGGEPKGDLRKAETLLEPLKQLWVEACRAVLKSQNPAAALAAMDKIEPKMREFEANVRGTSLEQPVRQGTERFQAAYKALQANDLPRAQRLMRELDKAGPGIEARLRQASQPAAREKSFEGAFRLDEDLTVTLEAGAADRSRMLWAKNIRFNKTTYEIRYPTTLLQAKLKIGYLSGPKARWQILAELLDSGGKVIGQAARELENSGDIVRVALLEETVLDLDFGNVDAAKIDRFRVGVEQIQPASAEPKTAQADIPKDAVTVGYAADAAAGKRSLGASGHAVIFKRPAGARFVEAVQIFAGRYGAPEPPAMDFHVYVLNEKYQVLADVPYPYSSVERGELRWVTLPTPSIEVPETFVIALAFNPDQSKGIYLGLSEGSRDNPHSLVGVPGSGFEPMKDPNEWMARAVMAAAPSGTRGVRRLADWKPPVEVDPFKGLDHAGYDEGVSTDKQSYGGRGPAIRFDLSKFDLLTPAAKVSYQNLWLKGFRLYAGRYGSGFDPERAMVKVAVLDSANKIRWQGEFPYSRFQYKSGWVDLVLNEPVPAAALVGEDRVITVAFDPEAHQTKGIYFHFNKNPQNPQSFVGKGFDNFQPLSDRQWIIRAYFQKYPQGPPSFVGKGFDNFQPLSDRQWIIRAYFQAAGEKPSAGGGAAAAPAAAATADPIVSPRQGAVGAVIDAAPVILRVSPAVGATDVDPTTTMISVTFDREMGGGMSWTGGGPEFPPSPAGARALWRPDKRTCDLPVKLEAGRFYRVGINSTSFQNFRSADGTPARPSSIYFTTQGASEELKAKVKKPEVVKMEPANGADNVNPSLKELRVSFNTPMGGGFSWVGGGPEFPKGRQGERPRWSEDGKTCVFPVTLEPGKSYRLGLNSPSHKNFSSRGGVPLDPVRYTFATKPQ